MKRSKFSEEQIVYAIRQAEAGTPAGDHCRQLGASAATFYAWEKTYAHMRASELRRLRQVEEENSRLRRLVADLLLDKHMLSEALRKKSLRPVRRRELAAWFHETVQVSCLRACRLAKSASPPNTDGAARRIQPPCDCVFAIWLMSGLGLGISASGCCCGARAGS
jgi:putative transposase